MITKSITIKIELEEVLPEAMAVLPKALNCILNEVWHTVRKADGRIPAFREQWEMEISDKWKYVAKDPLFEQPEMQIQQSEEF